MEEETETGKDFELTAFRTAISSNTLRTYLRWLQ
jgi:hypothetical protein